jgi:hypothetical protein
MQKPKQPDRRRYQQQRKPNDLSRCLAPLHSDHTLIAVVELSLSSWLVAGVVPGVERQPLKRLRPEPGALVELLHRWRYEADGSGQKITRIAVAYEAGRDGFWLARWLMARGLEAHVVHPASVAVSRQHRRAKTDRRSPRRFRPAAAPCCSSLCPFLELSRASCAAGPAVSSGLLMLAKFRDTGRRPAPLICDAIDRSGTSGPRHSEDFLTAT